MGSQGEHIVGQSTGERFRSPFPERGRSYRDGRLRKFVALAGGSSDPLAFFILIPGAYELHMNGRF